LNNLSKNFHQETKQTIKHLPNVAVACVEVTVLIQKVRDLNLCPDDRLSSTDFARFPSEYATTASSPILL